MDEKIKILLFGIIAEKIQAKELLFPVEQDSESLILSLYQRYPVLNELRFTLAVNKKIISLNTPISPYDEIALLPPFSGG